MPSCTCQVFWNVPESKFQQFEGRTRKEAEQVSRTFAILCFFAVILSLTACAQNSRLQLKCQGGTSTCLDRQIPCLLTANRDDNALLLTAVIRGEGLAIKDPKSRTCLFIT